MYFKIHVGFRSKRPDFQMSKVAKTIQDNIKHWLQLNEGYPGFQLNMRKIFLH
jgi:hypothetical protein